MPAIMLRIAITSVLVLLVAGCTSLRPDFETPTVTVKSLRAVPSDGAFPDFEIVLRVVNPNAYQLKLAGVAYTISLAGRDVVTGVGSDLPAIAAYGEGDVTLNASADLFAGLSVLKDIVTTGNDSVAYEFEAKLDPGVLSPAIRIRDTGTLSLGTRP